MGDKLIQQLRKIGVPGTAVLAFLVLLLVPGICPGLQKADNAGIINGVYISEQDFLDSFKGHFTGFVLEKDRRPDENEKKDLYNKTWRDITIHVILKQQFNKHKIQVTEAEVLDSLVNNIPESILRAPVYQVNGRFDKNLYISSLTSEKDKSLDWLRRYYYEYYVPLAKLKKELQVKDVISKKELGKLYKILNTSADIEWLVFNPKDAQVVIPQSEVENYYQTHIEDYKISKYAAFSWVKLPVVINQDDVTAVKAKADSIYFEITNGRSYANMIEQFSQAASAKSGGSLGFVKTEELSPRLKTALEGLNTNGYTRPLKIDNYWVIYQLAERTKNMVKLNELGLEITPGTENKDNVKGTAVHLRDLALQMGLDTAADEMGLTSLSSGRVAADSLWLSDADLSAYLIDRAFTQKAGALLEPVYSQALQAWIVTQVNEVQPLASKPLLEVNDSILNLLKTEKQKTATLEFAGNWVQNNRKQLKASASKDGITIESTPGITISGSVLKQTVNGFYTDIIDNYFDKKDQAPHLSGNYVLFPIVSKVRNLETPLIAEQEIRQFYFHHLNPNWFDKWLEDLIGKANVKIWYNYQ